MELVIENIENLHLHIDSSAIPARLEEFATSAIEGGASLRIGEPPLAVFTKLGEHLPGLGGYFGGTMPARDGKPGYHLIWSEAEAEGVKFSKTAIDVPGAASHYDGKANTEALLVASGEHAAAAWATGHRLAGFHDYYLPSHAELMLAFVNVPQLFKKDGYYWSSTQYSRYYAWVQDFEFGYSLSSGKDLEYRVRAVRQIPLL